MCGRFAASASTEEIVETFAVDDVVDRVPPSWNVAPTDAVSAVVERVDSESGDLVRRLVAPRWGLVPSWARDPSGGARMINARVETVATKPAFRKAFAARRCVIPADGYYEWLTLAPTRAGGKPVKQPWFIRPSGAGPFVMAGVFEFWRDPSRVGKDPWLTTCTIITTDSTDAVGHLHDRMPMTIAPDALGAWLDPTLTDPDAALHLLSVLSGDALASYQVSQLVNSVRNNSPALLDPVEPGARG